MRNIVLASILLVSFCGSALSQQTAPKINGQNLQDYLHTLQTQWQSNFSPSWRSCDNFRNTDNFSNPFSFNQQAWLDFSDTQIHTIYCSNGAIYNTIGKPYGSDRESCYTSGNKIFCN
jgi:hypothetical protein